MSKQGSDYVLQNDLPWAPIEIATPNMSKFNFLYLHKLFKNGCHNTRNVSIFKTIRGFPRQNNIIDYNLITDAPHIPASNEIG